MDVQHIYHIEDQVFGSNGEHIGTVVAVTPDYLHVASGLFGFGRNYYIPYDAVKDVGAGFEVLKIPASRISELGWEQGASEPPLRPRFGYYGTMPAPPVELAPLAPPPPPEPPATRPPEPMPESEPVAPAAEVPVQRESVTVPKPPPENPAASVCGHKLCDAHGRHLGKIRVVNPDTLEVSTGLFGLGPTLHVPLGHITRCEGDCCYLDLTAEQVEDAEWRR